MSITTPTPRRSLLCTVHLHHDIPVSDGNPENGRAMHLECTRCGRSKDLEEYAAATAGWLAKRTMIGL